MLLFVLPSAVLVVMSSAGGHEARRGKDFMPHLGQRSA